MYCSVPCKNEGIRIHPKIEGWSKHKVAYHMSDGVSRFKDIRQRIDLLIALGGRCVQCGYSEDFRGLVLDHKMSGGSEDRKRLGDSFSSYQLLTL